LNIASEVAPTCEFSDEKQAACGLIINSLLIAKNVGVGDAGEDANLIESISHFFGVAVGNFNFFHRVYKPVLFSLDFVDRGEGALAHLGDDIEILHCPLI
jgi:hypothetical protein